MALKSKAVSNNWEIVSKLFEASLRSAYHQTDQDFRIIAVCHETPQVYQSYDERVEIINVDFPPPKQVIPTLTMQDKWKKLAVGLVRAGQIAPDFVMIMDADDLVSSHLSHYANSHKQANGWILQQGYQYRYGSRWIYVDEHFNCGTNAIVSSKLIHFPSSLAPEEITKCLVLTHGHTVIKQRLEELGTPLAPLPFNGAVYVHSHGDNYSSPIKDFKSLKFLLGKLRRIRPMTRSIKAEFSLFY